jgi:hypothetical protein
MQEEFKIINKFSNYEISNFGNVKNIKTGKILNQYFNTDGYKTVSMKNDDGKKTKQLVHRLIGFAFIPNPNNKPYIDHINNDKANNNINNLRWATAFENCCNCSKATNTTSGSKGVRYHSRDKKWRAEIKYNRKLINIGSFDNKNDAILARVNKAKELFGEFINKCEKMPEEIELEELDKELTKIING